MNLYLLTQFKRIDYDAYDSVVVAAKNPELAVKIHPSGNNEKWKQICYSWCQNFSDVHCELIGHAKEGTQSGVILASFNAG